jgi:hypothetical protein
MEMIHSPKHQFELQLHGTKSEKASLNIPGCLFYEYVFALMDLMWKTSSNGSFKVSYGHVGFEVLTAVVIIKIGSYQRKSSFIKNFTIISI